MLKTALALILSVALTACSDFKMRGAVEIPTYLKTVYICPYAPYEPLQREVRMRLIKHGVKIIAQPTADATILQLSPVTTDEENLAEGSSGEMQRYKLKLHVSYTLIVKNKSKLQLERSITRSRELNRSINMLLSNEGQDQIVKKELLNEAVSEILRQITTRPTGT